MKNSYNGFRVMMSILTIIAVFIMVAPLLVICIAAFDPISLRFPIEGFTVKWFKELVENERFMKAMRVSLGLGFWSSMISTILAIMANIGLRYCSRKVNTWVSILMLSPLFVPSVIMGLALYQIAFLFFGGRQYWLLMLAHILLVLPYPFRTVYAAIGNISKTLDDAALSVGASPFRVVIHILIPMLKPNIFSGALLAFVTSWNDYNISMWLASTKYYPLSVQIYSFMKDDFSPVLAAMSVVLIIFSTIIVLFMNKFMGLSGVAGTRTTG